MILQAASMALADSVNVLLIGVLVALGVLLSRRGRFGAVSALLIAGDWLGVFLYALLVLLVFDGLGDTIRAALESPIYALVLAGFGLFSLVATARSSGEATVGLVRRVLRPLRGPAAMTPAVGFVLGVVQSATSVPFYLGIGVVSAGNFGVTQRYLGMVVYATIALSLPVLSAFAVAWVRRYPYSPVGRAFEWARVHPLTSIRLAGYTVGFFLLGLGAWTFYDVAVAAE
ncbi:hypothetical protein H7347_09835 [Corynebacterium sp. zg-331]|uniref:hypothetical protein n=1 Tax=unclassified Corynebacterium TaxID=2624378 RepID=UPI00128D0E75|nr:MULTISPECIES: hypothetical protein [unclassified Corynebacterium]MBC3186859.1 hypothetical protein [Corynebacterium sp. zg-331]MPV53339.1 hypothetical protein [Corynebacterium sp. zg331]